MTIILGLNAYHGDSAACLLKDGKLVAAAEEERFRRVKHWAGFPGEAIRYCMREAGVALEDIDAVAINQDSKANLWKKVAFTLRNRPDIGLVLDRLKNKREREGVDRIISRLFPGHVFKGGVYPVEHHLCHLSSAFHVSPFQKAVVVSVDGFGDFASGAWGLGDGVRIDIDGRVYFPHSLGIFYQALTQYLGFPHYGDEYKVMGLAPYGEPAFMNEMREIVGLCDDGSYRLNLEFFRHHREKVTYEWDNGSPVVGDLFTGAVADLLGPARKPDEPLTQKHKDIARSIQAMYEEAFFHLLNTLYRRHGVECLALAGGCAMNSVANGKICRNTPFKGVYVQSAAGDAGGAIGAAFSVWFGRFQDGVERPSPQPLYPQGAPRSRGERGFSGGLLEGEGGRFVMDHAYWGPAYSNEHVEALLAERAVELEQKGCSVTAVRDEVELCRLAAQAISEGKVVGWFQGRMEWGPRALGNRSIVCDPRRADMKDILNRKIKRRESFRPFAPSVLREAVGEWFEEDDDVPFMMKVFQIRAPMREKIPAVTHVDGSGRLQTVCRETNPRYYRLIESFRELTGVPMVLNTSFNENEPVVCQPSEALDCFLRTSMDVLVLGDFLLVRR